ncbi:hypothetical protein [Rhodohalobacter sulfatireducens]|uniref:Sulfotransferase domain-containing protein n=1 Tax=Rhodohalobacter sulfatireducens TaxID=2911366 RepID=A0ABS9KIY9_9BACT|nr:hypothetical protein [Rhodohalobacter sulfatireducens]MCG2590830.1 hypothetical protein [Rhodohalobacter sulfatireducens]
MTCKAGLIIHIGTHKTGTSAIQQHLKLNKKELLNENINYIKFKHRKLTKKTYEYDKSFKNNLEEYLKSKIIASRLNLISFEGLSGDLSNYYSNYKILAKILNDCTSQFNPKIVIFFRRQDQFIQSAFMQLKHQGEELSFSEFYNAAKVGNLNWLQFANYYEDLFGKDNVICIPYSPIRFIDESIINVFGRIINSESMIDHVDDKPINVGFSKAALNIFSSVSKDLSIEEKKILRRRLQRNFNHGLFTKYDLLSEKEEKFIIDKFKESNKLLSEKYWDKNYLNFNHAVNYKKKSYSTEQVYQNLLVDTLESEYRLLSKLNSTHAKLDRYERSKTIALLNYVRNKIYVFKSVIN